MNAFTMIDSGLDHNQVKFEKVNSLAEFMKQCQNSPMLIYGNDDHYNDFVKQFGAKFIIKLNSKHTDLIKDVPVGTVLFVTDPRLMRSFDYGYVSSTKNTMLSLLIQENFLRPRHFEQALGRVGRFGQACRRFILNGIRGYFEQQDDKVQNYIGRLHQKQTEFKK